VTEGGGCLRCKHETRPSKRKQNKTKKKHAYMCSPKCIYKQIHPTLFIIAPNSIKTRDDGMAQVVESLPSSMGS
jgi:hypothetical protein